MSEINRRRFLVGSVGALGAATACSTDTRTGRGRSATGSGQAATAATALAAPGTPGLVDEDRFQARADEYLTLATAELHADSPTGIVAHLIRSHREPDYTWDTGKVTVASLARTWEKIDAWEDTRDFDLMYLHWVHSLGRGETPATTIDPAVIDAIAQRLRANRYRYDDPLPPDRVDNQWFWSENHIVIGLVNEYLAGRAFPDETFTITGLTGTEHAARAKPLLLDWIAERGRFGFFEWHSHVYMLKNITPLLTLIELAGDPDLVAAGARALDLCLLDMAAHTHRGTYTASRGRTYKKDKMSARDEDTFGTNKLLFDDTDIDYTSLTDSGATYFCGARRYRPPQVVIDIATDDTPAVVRERHGLFVDGATPVTDHPEAPFGYDFADPANMSFWWSQGAIGMWQIAEVSLAEAKEHRLFEAELLAQVKALADLNGGDPKRIRTWEQRNHAIVNFGHLREANTYAWRGSEVMLASVLDHRFGQMRDQIHSWQATIDADALVFTTHPRTDVPASTDWGDDESPGYWTGEASVPRIAQSERTAIHIYQPAWDESTDALLWSVFGYQDYTHAYVPQDHFDTVVQRGNWTLLRKGGGYIALWSWRTPTWRVHDPAQVATRDMVKPFDLVAEGGPDNVWIVEVGESTDGTFDEFVDAITDAEPQVQRDATGFSVAWDSPASGAVSFGSTAPFTVEGAEIPQKDFPRHDSPWGTVDHLATTYEIASPRARLALDFEAGTRTVR